MSGEPHRLGRSALRSAFTLIEVMIVIAIVLALAGLVGYAVLGRRDEAKRNLADIDLKTIKGAMKMFRMDFDRYPTDDEGVKVLWDKSALSADADQTKWKGYLEEAIPKDRWDNPWVYKQAGEHGEGMYDLSAAGPDKQDGTDDDIASWKGGAGGGATGTSGTSDEPPPPPAPASPTRRSGPG